MAKSGTSFTAGNTAARKHGIDALIERGPSTVEPGRVGRLAELRQLVRTHPGRMELREEMAVRCAMICDIAFSEIVVARREGQPIFDTPVMKRAATWFAELRRTLDGFPAEGESGTAADIIRQAMGDEDDE